LDPGPSIGGAGDVVGDLLGTKNRKTEKGGNERTWSAAFISYAFKTAGAGNRFPYSRRHSEYIYHAVNNRLHLIDFANDRRDESKAKITNLRSVNENTVTDFTARFRKPGHNKQEQGDYRSGVTQSRDDASLAFHLVAYKLDDGYTPQAGDLVCYERVKSNKWRLKWNNPQRRFSSHTDIVVAATATNIEVIGGNVEDAVTKKHLAMINGGIGDANHDWIAIIRNLVL
jgi:hypothetical protein